MPIVGAMSPGPRSAATAGDDVYRTEARSISDAMILLAGNPLRSDGQLTVNSLAAEAQHKRHKPTPKHTGLKDPFYTLFRSQDPSSGPSPGVQCGTWPGSVRHTRPRERLGKAVGAETDHGRSVRSCCPRLRAPQPCPP